MFYDQFDEDEARWQIIPGDEDLAFGSHFRGDRFGAENDFFAHEYGIDTVSDDRLIGPSGWRRPASRVRLGG